MQPLHCANRAVQGYFFGNRFMTWEVFGAFVVTSLILAVAPGPDKSLCARAVGGVWREIWPRGSGGACDRSGASDRGSGGGRCGSCCRFRRAFLGHPDSRGALPFVPCLGRLARAARYGECPRGCFKLRCALPPRDCDEYYEPQGTDFLSRVFPAVCHRISRIPPWA